MRRRWRESVMRPVHRPSRCLRCERRWDLHRRRDRGHEISSAAFCTVQTTSGGTTCLRPELRSGSDAWWFGIGGSPWNAEALPL